MSRDGESNAYEGDKRNDNSSFLGSSSDSYDSESSSGSDASSSSSEQDYEERSRTQEEDQKWTSGAYASAASSQADDEFSGREREQYSDEDESSYESETDDEEGEDRTLPSIPPPPPTPTQSEMDTGVDAEGSANERDYDDEESSGGSDSQQSGSRDSQSLESEDDDRTWDDADASAAPSQQEKLPPEGYESAGSSDESSSGTEENTVEEGEDNNAAGNWAAFDAVDNEESVKYPADSSVLSGTHKSELSGSQHVTSAFNDDIGESRNAQSRNSDPFGFGKVLGDDDQGDHSGSERSDEEEDSFFRRAKQNDDDESSADDDDSHEDGDRLGQLQELQQPSQESFDGGSTITTRETQWEAKEFLPVEQDRGGFEGSQGGFDDSVFDQSTLGEESKVSFGDPQPRPAHAVPGEENNDFRSVMMDEKATRALFMSEVTLDTDAPDGGGTGSNLNQESSPDIESPVRQDSYLDFPDKPRADEKTYCWGLIKDRCDMAIACMFSFVVLFLGVSVIVIEFTPWV